MHPLISASALRQSLQQGPAPMVLDARFNLGDPEAGARAFEAGHIDGARYVHLNRDLSAPLTGTNGRHPLPTREAFEGTLDRLGLRAGTPVVAYDDQGGMFAARLWWMLHWAGHPNVQVLDGGWAAWKALNEALDAHPNDAPTASATTVSAPRPSSFAPLSVDQVLAHLNDPHQQLLDARGADRFRGENETLDPVGGHIPGALNRPFMHNLQADGRFLPAEALRQAFTSVLAGTPPEDVVHQCGSGVTACHNLLAMEVAGLHGSRLYPGSWSEWCADPRRPVTR
jgi:thiosulfate/3-mercaptopyruvate sulfurtransferase